ncbi:hypothetical protein Vi05172_g4306 [Venturia inaequalis]|uniref:chitinase n=1 Tax=Venturia inaequalis TaxID=5025 RepID=A0A8H3VJ45_VENIN|nr:hypothetical protein EG327_002247 [Venturia inaequalis]RDI85484.1 hypothetical protein Vi05172_g4306 [Venturia inaequalis]
MRYFHTLSVLALASISLAQTFSDCDPTKKTGCPTKPGLLTEFNADFRQGADAAKEFTTTTGSINYVADGAEYSITKLGEGPTIQSNFYIQFGYVEVVMKAAPGAGIVSSFVMESDALDEIDWEWIGSDTARAQSNYFVKGNTTTYDRGQFHPVTGPETTFTKYAVNWTQETTTWLVNDAPVRTLNFADAMGGLNYPQTPMNIRFGNWVAGSPGNSPGTIQWAGGLTDFSKGPFNMVVQSVKIINYNPATSYAYKDMSGSFQSIEALGAPAQASLETSNGRKSSNSTGPGEVPFASPRASDSAYRSSATGSSESAAKSGSDAKPSVVSITLSLGQGQPAAAAAAATKSPCSTVSGAGAQGQAAAATGASKPPIVSINVGKSGEGMGPGAAAATAMASGSSNSTTPAGQGIVAAGAPATNGTLPVVTIQAGGAASAASSKPASASSTLKTTGILTAPPEGATTAFVATGTASFGIGSSTAAAQPQQVTTNAGSKLEIGGVAIAAFAGFVAVW